MFEVALTVSPKGWKKTRREWLEEFADSADSYYEENGWQLWYWANLESDCLTLLKHAVVDVSKEEYRLVSICRDHRTGEQVGEVGGPFDLGMGTRGEGNPGHWMHIDLDYGEYFFREC